MYDLYFVVISYTLVIFFFFKQKTAYEMRISDWSSDVCSSDLARGRVRQKYFLQRQGHRDVVRQPIRAASNLPQVILPVRPQDLDRQVLDDELDRGFRPLGVELRDHPRGGVLDPCEREAHLATDLRLREIGRAHV